MIVAEKLNNKSTYNTLELAGGCMAKVGKGDIVVGALDRGARCSAIPATCRARSSWATSSSC